MKKLIGPAIIAVAIIIGGGAMMLASAGDPEVEPVPTTAVLLLCSPDCKVVEETPQDELIAGLEDEIERMRTFITRVDQCIPGNRNICWEGMKDFLLPDFDED